MVADLRLAVVGTGVWTAAALATATGAVELTLVDLLLALAPLVVVPVGFVVAGQQTDLLRLAAAVLVVPALIADTGVPAGVLALPWLAVAVHLAAAADEAAAGRWATAGTLLTIVSPPIVAIGFTTRSALAQIAGAVLLTAGVWIVAGVTAAAVGPRTNNPGARALLIISAAAVVLPMVLAVFWATGQHFDVPALDVPAMARVHGTLIAFGFSLAGLLGWVARDTTPAVRRSVTP